MTRYEVSLYIGPCSQEEAEALMEAITDLPEAHAVGAGAVGLAPFEESTASSVSAGAGLPVHLGYDDEEGDRIYFSVGRAAWERAGSPRHLVAGARQVPADTIEKTRKYREQAGWVLQTTRMAKSGYAPRKATLAQWVIELADVLAAVRTPEEQT